MGPLAVPVVVSEVGIDLHQGPVPVTIEYSVAQSGKRSLGRRSIHIVAYSVATGRIGGIFRHTEVGDRYRSIPREFTGRTSASTPAADASRPRTGAALAQLPCHRARTASPERYVFGRNIISNRVLPRFCRTHATVLDCANGYQKENQEEVHEVEENCPWQGDADEETDTEGEDS